MKANIHCQLTIQVERIQLQKPKNEACFLLVFQGEDLLGRSGVIRRSQISSEIKEIQLEYRAALQKIQETELEFQVILKSVFQRRVTSKGRLLLSALRPGKDQLVLSNSAKEPEAWIELKVDMKLLPNPPAPFEESLPPPVPDLLEKNFLQSLVLKLDEIFVQKSETTDLKAPTKKPWKYRLMKHLEGFVLKTIQKEGYLSFFENEIKMSSAEFSMYYYLTPRIAESKMYVFGDDQVPNVYEFSFSTEKFKKIEKPQAIFMFGSSVSCALPNGKIMITGGINKSFNIIVSSAYLYDPIKNKTELLSDMKQSRYSHSICYYDGHVYVLGGKYYGKDKDGILNHVERYSLARNVWENLKPMKEKRCCAPAIVYKSHLYVFGGSQGTTKTNKIEKYDFVADEWTQLSMLMPVPIDSGSAFLVSNEGKVVYLGGKEDKSNSSECIVYDVVNGTYEKEQKLNSGRVLARSAVHRNQIYLFGGAGMTWEKAEIGKWDWTNQGSYINSVNSEMKLFSSATKNPMEELSPNELLEPFVVFLSGKSSSQSLGVMTFKENYIENPIRLSWSYAYRDHFRVNTKDAGSAPTILGYVLVVGGVDSFGNVLRDSHLINHSEMLALKEDPKKISQRVTCVVPTQAMRHERKNPAVCAFSCFNYVFGGLNKHKRPWRSCERFNFEANEWDSIKDMPFGVSKAKAVQISQETIGIVGGFVDQDQKIPNRSIVLYSVESDSWTILNEKLPEGLFDSGELNAAANEERIFVFSGNCQKCLVVSLNSEKMMDSIVELDTKFSRVYSVFITKRASGSSESNLKSTGAADKAGVPLYLKIFGKAFETGELRSAVLELSSLKTTSTVEMPKAQHNEEKESVGKIDLEDENSFAVSPFSHYQKAAFVDALGFLNLQLVNNQRRLFIFTKDTKTSKSTILTYSFLSENFQALSPPENFTHFEGSSAIGLYDGTILVSGGIGFSTRSLLAKNNSFIFSPFSNSWTETSPMNTPRANHSLVKFKGGILAIGGQSKGNCTSSTLSSTEIFTDFQWHEGPLLKFERSCFGVTVMSNGVYVLGGRDSKGKGLDSIERFDPDSAVWEVCEKKLPCPMPLAKAVTLSYNEILLLGNESSSNSEEALVNELFLLEFTDSKSFRIQKSFKTLFLYKELPQFSVVGNKLFLIGGNRSGKNEMVSMDVNGVTESGFFEIPSYDNLVNGHLAGATSAISEVEYSQTSYSVSEKNHRFLYIFGTETNPIIERLDLENMHWSEVPKPANLTIWDYSIALTIPSGQIFICGGINSQLNNIKRSAYLVTPELGERKMSCEVLPNMFQDRYTHTCGFVNNYVYVMGGRNFGHGLQGVLQHCERFNLTTKKWEKIAPLKAKRCTATAFSFKNSIYIVGGFRGDGRVKCIERYNESIDEWMSVPLLLTHPVEAETLIHLSDREILLLGGKDDFAEQQYISMYNFERNTCTMMKPDKFMTATRVLAKSAKYRDQIVVIGGNQVASSEKASIWNLKWAKFDNTFKLIGNNFTRTAFAQSY